MVVCCVMVYCLCLFVQQRGVHREGNEMDLHHRTKSWPTDGDGATKRVYVNQVNRTHEGRQCNVSHHAKSHHIHVVSSTYVSPFDLCQEADYPYTSANTDVAGTCTPPSNNTFVPLAPAYKQVSLRFNVDALATAVVQRPIALYVDGSCAIFQSYGSGVITDPSCTNGTVNHALLLVGYGTYSDATPYWKVGPFLTFHLVSVP